MVDSYNLRHEDDYVWQLCPRCRRVTKNGCDCSGGNTEFAPLIEKDTSVCNLCGGKYRDLTDRPYYERYELIAVAGSCRKHDYFIHEATSSDLAALAEADRLRLELDFGSRASFRVTGGPKSNDLIRNGVKTYLDVFSSRQLLVLAEVKSVLDTMEGTVRQLLAMLVSTSLEFNSLLCGYKGAGKRRPGAIRHTFAHHAYSFPYTAAENNPINPIPTSGNLRILFRDRVLKARAWAKAPEERKVDTEGKAKKVIILGEFDGGVEVDDVSSLRNQTQCFFLNQGSSANLPIPDDFVDFVVTDPPYFDSVQYSDLAEYFRVWLAYFLPNAANWTYDVSGSAVGSGAADSEDSYSQLLGAIFREANRVLRPDDGRLVFTFHHWRAEAWAALTRALTLGGFHLINCYVVSSENPASVHINKLNAITHDCVLVLAPEDGNGPKTEWATVITLDTTDSYAFCRDCGNALGWALSRALTDPEVKLYWRNLLQR